MRRLISALALVAACGGSDDPPGTGGADAAPDPDAVTVACGTRGGARGMSAREASVGALRRTYLVYLPRDVPASEPVPLVFVHHGYTMSGAKMVDATAYTALADAERIAVAFPDGQGGPDSTRAPWNVGTAVCPSAFGPPPIAQGDDFSFLDAMRDDIAADQCIDRDHVFVTGFSMGGYFAHHAGCMRDDIRAIAPHSGGTHDLAGCATAKKPVIIFHGTADGVIPLSCSDPMAATAWAQRNGCAATTTSVAVTGGTCKSYDGCPPGGQVELCTFTGMGHCWAGGPASGGVFTCPAFAAATELEWQFFRRHAW